ncbi:MAG: hypothetical protein AAFQ63_13185 [Cyanobacteria bacterium J06621_11]
MRSSIKSLLTSSSSDYYFAALFALSVLFSSLPVKAQQFCSASDSPSYGEPPAEIRRTVELANLGVAVSIPENYRTIPLQNDAIQIVHPSIFDMLQCLGSGGQGGHGYYFETINLVEDDLTMDLEAQATWLAGYNERRDGTREPLANQIIPYENNEFSGYIVTNEQGYDVNFLGVIPGYDSLLEVSAQCDCQVDVAVMSKLLSDISVLD